MARRFFYVCAGMLMLALSYHLGASNATAQSGAGQIVALNQNGYDTKIRAITRDGQLYVKDSNQTWNSGVNVLAEAGISGEVVDMETRMQCSPGAECGMYVVTAAGDVCYQQLFSPGPWTALPNVFDGATPARRSTWGQLKSRYR